MDNPVILSTKEQLEEVITIFANSWLQLTGATPGDVLYEKGINQFMNLNLRTVYELVDKDVLKELQEGATQLIKKESLLEYLRPPRHPPEPVVPASKIYAPRLIDETNGKTFLEGWSHRQRHLTKASMNLHQVLRWANEHTQYLEDVTIEKFQVHSKSKILWELFVKLRGY